jgi:ribosome assembly protein 1
MMREVNGHEEVEEGEIKEMSRAEGEDVQFAVPRRPASRSGSRRPTPRPGTSSPSALAVGLSERPTMEQIRALLSRPLCLRNVCILAHVDHGKTTLADSLVAYNQIISSRQAGHLRYLDSRPDEQLRGITMQSSSITLLYHHDNVDDRVDSHHSHTLNVMPVDRIDDWLLVNLIDSPGHVDFGGQVQTATRLTDGAILVVDVVEGVCAQTLTVLRQARTQRLALLVVLNKVDRLFVERKLTAAECAGHVHDLLSTLRTVSESLFDGFWTIDHRNTLLASALDGWAFGGEELTRFYVGVMGMHIEPGDWWGESHMWDGKRGACVERLGHQSSVLAKLALEPVQAVYQLLGERDDAQVEARVSRMTSRLHVPPLTPRDLRGDRRGTVRALLSRWLPIAPALFEACRRALPAPTLPTLPALIPVHDGHGAHLSPKHPPRQNVALPSKDTDILSSSKQMEHLLSSKGEEGDLEDDFRLALHISERRDNGATQVGEEEHEKEKAVATLVYVSKLLAMPRLQVHGDGEDHGEEGGRWTWIGMARCLQGSVHLGQRLHLLADFGRDRHKHDASNGVISDAIDDTVNDDGRALTVTGLYVLMGRDSVLPVESVYAGNVFGLALPMADMQGGDDDDDNRWILPKSFTLSDDPTLVGLDRRFHDGDGDADDWGSDGDDDRGSECPPLVEVTLQPEDLTQFDALARGLRRLCLADPLATYDIAPDTGDHVLRCCGELHLEQCLADLRERFHCPYRLAGPPIVRYRETVLSSHSEVFSSLPAHHHANDECKDDTGGNRSLEEPERIRVTVEPLCRDDGKGGRGVDNELLILDPDARLRTDNPALDDDGQVKSAFTLAINDGGPLCGEPLQSIKVSISFLSPDDDRHHQHHDNASDRSNQDRRVGYERVLWIKECIRTCVQRARPTLLVPMYRCTVQCPPELVGRVYGVLNKRHGIMRGEQCLSSHDNNNASALPLREVQCWLPVAESFGLADDLRSRTSGAAFAQLAFDGYRPLAAHAGARSLPAPNSVGHDNDDHYEEDKDKDEGQLLELTLEQRYVQEVRLRKGRSTGRLVTVHSEKQRTLSRK